MSMLEFTPEPETKARIVDWLEARARHHLGLAQEYADQGAYRAAAEREERAETLRRAAEAIRDADAPFLPRSSWT